MRYNFVSEKLINNFKTDIMERNFKGHSHFNKMKKIVLGLVLATAGFLLLGFNTGYLPSELKSVIFTWPMLLIALGVVNISSRESRFMGIMLLGVGSFFMALRIYQLDFNVIWPLLLIFAGVMTIFKNSFKHKSPFEKDYCQNESKTFEHGKIDENNVLSGSKIRFENEVFRGGQINNVFGGSEVDFTGATLSDEYTELEVNCVFGGVKIIVPADWTVQLKVVSIMGGFSDKRRSYGKSLDGSNKKTLIIKGSTIFGGGEIRSN